MPLAVQFECKHCPRGLFGVLITFLLANRDTFQLDKEEIFKDQVSLKVSYRDVVNRISLKAFSTHFEVKFFPEKNKERRTPIRALCNKVREEIESSIEKSIDHLNYDKKKVEPKFGFQCPYSTCRFFTSCSQSHPVKSDKGYHTIHCDKMGKGSRIPGEGK